MKGRQSKGSQQVSVADLIEVMEQLAPPSLAEAWDNCGLQVGAQQWPVKKIWVALDPLLSVLQAAAGQQVDMIITHHPLLFKPLRNLDFETPVGRAIEVAMASRMAIYAAHTNLDSAKDGINDILACRVGLTNLVPLEKAGANDSLEQSDSQLGLGRVGRLEPSMTVGQMVQHIKSQFKLKAIKVAGNVDMKVDSAAVCSGGGSTLVEAFLKTGAQVYISGDLRYHDARAIEDAGRALIDIGHFPSEHVMVDDLAARLTQAAKSAGWQVHIEPCKLERDPFEIV